MTEEKKEMKKYRSVANVQELKIDTDFYEDLRKGGDEIKINDYPEG